MKLIGHYNAMPIFEDENIPPGQVFFVHEGAYEPFTLLHQLTRWQRIVAWLHRQYSKILTFGGA